MTILASAGDGMSYFPLDVRELRKGQVIEVAEVEKLVNRRRSDLDYPLRVLGLREQIRRELGKLGIVLTLRIVKGAILICDDAQASQYNERQGALKLRGFKRAYKRNLAVDMSLLDSDQRAQHERALVYQGTMMGALHAGRKKLAGPTPKRRETPRLGAPENGDNKTE